MPRPKTSRWRMARSFCRSSVPFTSPQSSSSTGTAASACCAPSSAAPSGAASKSAAVKEMGRTSGSRFLLIALLGLPALRAPAAASTPEAAYREARALYDGGKWKELAAATDDASVRFAGSSSEALEKLRILRGAAYLGSKDLAARYVVPELPTRLRDSDIAVIRLRLLGTLAYQDNRD